jgi:uncharacterized protein (DUF1015 family)
VSTQSAPARIVHPIASAWVSTGGTGAQNYDEFAADAEITEVVAANPDSSLAVEMPHCTPAASAAGKAFADCLDEAAATLGRLRDSGRFRPATDVLVPYRISGGDGTGYGLFCVVDTDQISTSADEPGLVIRNEAVFPAKVRERAALTARLGTVLSPVLLLAAERADELNRTLAEVVARLGEPAVTDTDQQGREHAVWLLGPGEQADRLRELAGGGPLVVADGNHRSLAAQQGGQPRFLAVITTPESVRIRPYNRLIRSVGMPVADVLDRLAAAGATVTEVPGRPEILRAPVVEVPEKPGTIVLYGDGRAYALTLPSADTQANVVDRLDHTVTERLLIDGALGMDPGDKRITYVGGDYDAGWLVAEVDAGRADLAVLIPPVRVEDFVEVNLARLTMPRKSTWFVPKARAGLVLADVLARAP